MLAHNLYYLNFAGRLMLPPRVVVHMEGGKGGNAAAPSLAPPTVPPPRRELLLTLCGIVGRALSFYTMQRSSSMPSCLIF
jgi:hypothetical protein